MSQRIFGLFFLLFSSFLLALPRGGTLAGKVVDQHTQQPLVGVNVVVENTLLGATTDEEGFFVILQIPSGSYNIRFEYLGYRTLIKSNVIINPGRKTVLNVEMQIDVLEGEKVEVTASAFVKPAGSVISNRSMDFEEIRRDPGSAMDIQRAMQALPSVVSGTDQENEIIVRGGAPGENLFLMDNMEIPNPNHFTQQGRSGGPINMINPTMVQKVDFYAGAFSARYGDKASSVMDITLREGDSEAYHGEIQMGMSGAGLLVEGPLRYNSANFIFSARKSFLDLIISSTGLVAVPHYQNTQLKLTFPLHKSHKLFINGIYGNDNIRIEGEGTGGYAYGAENVAYKSHQWTTGATLRSLWSPHLISLTTLFANEVYWDIDEYHSRTRDSYYLNRSKEREISLRSDFTWQPRSQWLIQWGGSLKQVHLNHQISMDPDTIFLYRPDQNEPIGIFKIIPEWIDKNLSSSYKSALYGQIGINLFKSIHFTGGLRYDYFDYNNFASLSPRVGFSIYLTPKFTLNAAFGVHYQSPAYIELTAHPNNRHLKSKYTRQFVLGIEHLIGNDIKWTLEVYWKNYYDVPVLKSLTTPDPFDSFQGERLNIGKGWARGIEFFFQKKLTHHFSTIVSYSFSRATAQDPRWDKRYDWDFDYRHIFNVVGGYKLGFHDKQWYQDFKRKWWYHFLAPFLPLADEVEISFKFRYSGGRPYTPPVYHPEFRRWITQEQQLLNTHRYPPYHRLDFRVDRRYFFNNWNMVVFFDMMNVYNRHNIWEYQYNDDGSREEVLQFEVLPVGGVLIEF
ncbi:MAG: TonB-dependent receptor [Calditrichaeota bacterium]|nr:MAG: TonB-dependent receptor [Calditrichota bacterium]